MSYTANNNALYVAAFEGALSGSLAGRNPVSHTASDYAGLVAACGALAQEVDSQIGFDSAITTGSSTPTILAITGSSNAQVGPEIAKTKLLFGIVAGVIQGRILTDATAADYAVLATQIAAIYTEGLTGIASYVP